MLAIKVIIFFILVLNFNMAYGKGSSNLIIRNSMGEEIWVYNHLEKLKMGGLLGNSTLSTRPITRAYAVKLLEAAKNNANKKEKIKPGLKKILARLEKEFEGELDFRMPKKDYLKLDKWETNLYLNNGHNTTENINGDWFNKGISFRKELLLRGDLKGFFSFYMHNRIKFNENKIPSDYNLFYHPLGAKKLKIPRQKKFGIDFLETYLKYTWRNVEVEFGRDSQWWGVGYHGSTVLSNNVLPLTMLKMGNPIPFRLPWIFKYIGETKVVWFLARLEEDRAQPHSYINGWRLDITPFSFFEMGISRVIQFAGPGFDFTPDNYIKVQYLRKEDTGNARYGFENNQLAAVDFAFTISDIGRWVPYIADGVKIYYEMGGDDQSTDIQENPVGGGYLGGFFITDLFSLGVLDFRFEYANFHEEERKDVHDLWYNHGKYGSGYTYKGKIVGHHMGTDADDLFVRLVANFDKIQWGINYNKERHRIFESENNRMEVKHEGSVDAAFVISEHIGFNAKYEFEKISNSNFMMGETDKGWYGSIGLEYNY